MPGVFKRALNAVKDQATISIVRFSKNDVPGSSCDLDVAILKATTHEEQMADEKHTTEVVLTVVSSTHCAAACVHALARRIARTRDWVVALKSLQLVHHLLRDGGTYFAHEVASLRPTYSGGRRLLDLSNFSASQSSHLNPWDYTAFVRTYARYLDARLESAIFGKLRNLNHKIHKATNLVGSMKPAVLLDHIDHWRRLLDRAISMKPTGPTRYNRLVQITLFMVTRESFQFYRDITSGLTLLLDKFFQLDQKCRVNTVEACESAARQFEELDSLYSLCINICVGKMIEYPHVQMISHNLVTTLKSYLHNSLVPVESSLASETRSQPRFSFQSLPREMSDEVQSEYYSVASEPISAKAITYEHTCSSSMPFYDTKDKPERSESEGWELLLVETASKLSDSENGSYGQRLLLESAKKPLPQNYHNPFLQDCFNPEISIAEKPTQYSFNKNLSTERTYHERRNVYAETEKSCTDADQTLAGGPSTQQSFQRHLRWMQEQQKVYRSIGY